MSDQVLVEAKGLTKYYGSFCALSNVDLTLEKGKIIGILGPNGSGKTTFIKMLAGLLNVSSGTLTIDGHTPGIVTKGMVSYLPERPYFAAWMRVDQCLDYFADFYSDFDRALAEQMLSDLGVSTAATLRTLSKGTKEKVQLVLVMARRAKLYLLDEPIAGVDPAAREYILRTIVRAYHPEATVLISTHLIADVEPVLDECILIHGGKILMHGEPRMIHEQYGMDLDRYFREVFKCIEN